MLANIVHDATLGLGDTLDKSIRRMSWVNGKACAGLHLVCPSVGCNSVPLAVFQALALLLSRTKMWWRKCARSTSMTSTTKW